MEWLDRCGVQDLCKSSGMKWKTLRDLHVSRNWWGSGKKFPAYIAEKVLEIVQ